MRFQWNAEKNQSNLRKHGVSFDTATKVFDDPGHVMEQDREVDGEELWQTVGRANGVWLLLVAHTVLDLDGEEEDVIFRIISARRATARERRRYEAKTY